MKKAKWPLIGLGVLLIIIAILLPSEEVEKKEEQAEEPNPSAPVNTQEAPKVAIVPKSPEVKKEDFQDAEIVE